MIEVLSPPDWAQLPKPESFKPVIVARFEDIHGLAPILTHRRLVCGLPEEDVLEALKGFSGDLLSP